MVKVFYYNNELSYSRQDGWRAVAGPMPELAIERLNQCLEAGRSYLQEADSAAEMLHAAFGPDSWVVIGPPEEIEEGEVY